MKKSKKEKKYLIRARRINNLQNKKQRKELSMGNKKLYNICKNIIAITLTIAMMMYFGYEHSSLAKTYAETGEQMTSESTEASEQSSLQDNTKSSQDSGGDNNTNGSGDLKGNDNVDGSDGLGDSDGEESTSGVNVGGDEDVVVDVSTVIATITYSYSANNKSTETAEQSSEAKSTETTEQISEAETVTLEFYTLSEAFNGTIQATEIMASYGYTDYVATIKIIKDFTLTTPALNERNSSFNLDLNGHCITCENNSYIDFGEGNVTITDETENVLGRVVGAVPYLFTGTGNITFDNGYFENSYSVSGNTNENNTGENTTDENNTGENNTGENTTDENNTDINNNFNKGYIVDNAGSLTFNNGCFFANGGQIVNTISGEELKIFVNGGYYTFDVIRGFSNLGITVFSEGRALVESDILINDNTVSAYAVLEPDYQVAISIAASPENGLVIDKEVYLYYTEINRAWDRAVNFSKNNSGALVAINICNKEITEISLDRTLELNKEDEATFANIMFVGAAFTRKAAFDGNMFAVTGGKLIFDNCTLDGFIDNESVSQGSVIRISGDGEVSLKDTSVENNRSVANGVTGDPGAGIYLAAGATLKLAGNIKVINNTLYTPATAYEKAFTTNQNLYLAEGAKITLSAPVTGNTSDVGITNERGTIAGLTSLGMLELSYLDGVTDNLLGDEQIVFTIDNYPSFFLSFDKLSNNLYWDKTVRYLPEAGVMRFEFLVLFIGLLFFILRNLSMMKKNKGVEVVATVIAITCLVSGSAIGFINLSTERAQSEENQQVLRELSASRNKTVEEKIYQTEETEAIIDSEEESELKESIVPDDGREYYGMIEIEELGIRLPVLKEYTDANMKTTPCVYYGQAESDNLVVVGHNYDSQLGAFNNIEGTLHITMQLVDGSVYEYQSTAVEYLKPEQVDEMLMGHWDFTVFTCSYSGQERIAVRCDRIR